MARPKTSEAAAASSGVEQLIAKLRDQGVQAGQAEAEAIVEKARIAAERTLAEAEAKADRIVAEAREEAEKMQNAGREALRIATRDTILRFQQELMGFFDEQVRRLVSEELEDPELLGRLLAEIARQAAGEAAIAEAEELEVLLPRQLVTVDELKKDPEALRDRLSELVKQIAQTTWREGVTFKALGADARGIRIKVTDKDVDVDLTATAVAAILLEHMQPRFRALMQGIID